MLGFFRFPFLAFEKIRRLSRARAGKGFLMSIFLLSCSLFVILAGIFALHDTLYARQAASNGKATEILP